MLCFKSRNLINYLFLLPALALHGQAPGGGIFGVQVSLIRPSSGFQTPLDLAGGMRTAADSRPGYGAGFFTAYPFPDAMLRGGMEYAKFPTYSSEGTYKGTPWSYSTDLSGLMITLDYLYFPGGGHRGTYLLGGFSYTYWKESMSAQGKIDGWLPATVGDSHTWNKGGLGAGIGYKFDDRQSLELKFGASKIGTSPMDSPANTLSLSYLLRIGRDKPRPAVGAH